MYRLRTDSLTALALVGLLVAPSAQPQLLQSRLLPYTRCPLSGGLDSTLVERASGLPMARPVETGTGEKRVSVADGYRVILAFPNTDPFVNLKVELSMAGRYGADKQIVLEQMQHMSATARGAVVKLERRATGGVDVAALNNPGLEGTGLGLYTFFVDAKNIIVTAYLLNQVPDRRAFQSVAEYQSLRDRFVNDLVTCLNGTK